MKGEKKESLKALAEDIARARSSLPYFYEACLRQGLTTAQGEKLLLIVQARLKPGRVNRKG